MSIVRVMDSWEEVQSMQRAESIRRANIAPSNAPMRSLLIFLIAVWIVEILVIWRMPETIDLVARVIPAGFGNRAPSMPKRAAEPAAAGTVRSQARGRAAARSSRPNSKPPGVAAVVEDVRAPVDRDIAETSLPSEPAAANQVLSQASVKAESTAMHISNSVDSPVTHVLPKGATVETRLEVIDSGGPWSLVEGDGTTGFVKSEALEHRPGVSPTDR